jgi:ribosomal protein L29
MAKKIPYITHSAEELNRTVAAKREELRSLRFSASGGKNRNVKLFATLRKEVARALTALSSQRIAASKK